MKEEFSDRRGKLFHFNSCLTNRQVIEDLGIVFILFKPTNLDLDKVYILDPGIQEIYVCLILLCKFSRKIFTFCVNRKQICIHQTFNIGSIKSKMCLAIYLWYTIVSIDIEN